MFGKLKHKLSSFRVPNKKITWNLFRVLRVEEIFCGFFIKPFQKFFFEKFLHSFALKIDRIERKTIVFFKR